MFKSIKNKYKNHVTLILIFSVLLMSCFNETDDSFPAERPFGSVSGNAIDALIVDGSLSIYAYENGRKGELLATTITNSSGGYAVSLQSKNRPVLLEITGGYYIEEASGVKVLLKDGQKLRAVTFYQSGKPLQVMVTPFTNMAAGLAEYKVSQGVNIGVAITEATSAITSIIGLDILSTYPKNITDPNNFSLTMTDEYRYGFITAGISSWTNWASIENSTEPHTVYTSIALSQLIYDDIVSDGFLDGVILEDAISRPLAFGTVPITANVYRTDLAKHVISFSASKKNKTGLGISDVLDLANDLSQTTNGIFDKSVAQPIDITPPVIAALSAENQYTGGVFSFSVSVTDFVGVNSVAFDVDGVEIGIAPDTSLPVIEIDSTEFIDGAHLIGVRATDNVGNEGYVQFSIIFDNTNPFLTVESSRIVNESNYILSGIYTDQGAGIDLIYVNDVIAYKNTDGTWFSEISLVAGANTVALKIVDNVGNVVESEEVILLDEVSPVITVGYSPVTFVQNNSTFTGSLRDAAATGNPLTIAYSSLSTLGLPHSSSAYLSSKIPYFYLEITDPVSNGVNTIKRNLVVEYSYSLNGNTVVSFKAANKSTDIVDAGAFLIPLSNESLLSSWYQSSITDIHSIIVRVVDEGGNVSLFTHSFKVDFDLQDITINAALNGATANLYSYTEGVKGGLIGSCVTDIQGVCSYGLFSDPQPILVEVVGGSYIEVASSSTVSLEDNEGYSTIVLFDSKDVTAIVTPLTDLATFFVSYQLSESVSRFSEAYSISRANFIATYRFDVFSVVPVDVTNPSSITTVLTNGHQYGLQLAALSQYTYWASIESGIVPHTLYTTYSLTKKMRDDIAFDGVLNGVSINGILTLGTVVLNDEQYRSGINSQLIEFAKSDLSLIGLDSVTIFDYANAVAGSSTAIFGNSTAYDLDANGPSIVFGVGNGWQNGTIILSAEVSDNAGISSVSFEIDGIELGSAIDPLLPRFNLDTTNYTDGIHTIGITSVDQLSNTSYRKFLINIDNTPASFSVASLGISSINSMTLTGSVSDADSGVQSLTIDGQGVTVADDGTWSLLRALPAEGNNMLSLKIVDVAGNATNDSIQVLLDTVSPSFTVTSPSITAETNITLTGSVSDAGSGVESFTIDGQVVTVVGDGTWSLLRTLPTEGNNTFSLKIVDVAGNATNDSIQVLLDTVSPSFTVTSPSITAETNITLTGLVSDSGSGVESLTIDGQVVTVAGDGTWSLSRTLSVEGNNAFSINTIDLVGNTTISIISVLRDSIAPTFTFSNDQIQSVSSLILSGLIAETGSGIASMTIGGVSPILNRELNSWDIFVQLSEGANDFEVVITDNTGNVTTSNINIVRDTTDPIITVTSASYVGNATYTLTGSYVETGSGISRITVNGSEAMLNPVSNAWSLSVSLNGGDNTYTILATDNAENKGSVRQVVTYDTAPPTQTPFYSSVTYSNGSGGTIAGTMQTATASTNPLYVLGSNISSGTIDTTTGLGVAGIPYYGLNVRDSVLGSANTANADIVVKMQYKLNSVVKNPWRVLLPSSASPDGSGYVIPISTQGLHSSWVSATKNDIHRIELELSDTVGNTQTYSYEFKVEFIAPALNVVVADINSWNQNFANRQSLINTELKANTYTFTNNSDAYTYIKLSDSSEHSASSFVNYLQRRNDVRYISTTEWRVKTTSLSEITIRGTSPISGWIEDPSIQDFNGSSWVSFIRPITYGTIQSINSDSKSAPSTTVWAAKNKPNAVYADTWGCNYYCLIYYDWRLATNTDSVVYNCVEGYTCGVNWEERTAYAYVSEAGYPKNISSNTTTNAIFSTNRFEVVDSVGNAVSSVSGWYKVFPREKVTISKYVKTPVFTIYDDASITDSGTFSSYTKLGYDKTLTWNVDRALKIERSLGDSVKPTGLSLTSNISSAVKAYVVGR